MILKISFRYFKASITDNSSLQEAERVSRQGHEMCLTIKMPITFSKAFNSAQDRKSYLFKFGNSFFNLFIFWKMKPAADGGMQSMNTAPSNYYREKIARALNGKSIM